VNTIFITAAAAFLSTPAAISQTIALHPAETVVVRLGNDGPIVESRGPAMAITKFEAYTLWRAETQTVVPGVKVAPPGSIFEGEGAPSPPKPAPDRLRITMRLVPGLSPGSPEQTALFIENGYASALRYRALMVGHGQSAPTDVCDVAPHLLGLENWPYALDELDLSDLALEQWSGAIQCQ
jgi:hypothetical protein